MGFVFRIYNTNQHSTIYDYINVVYHDLMLPRIFLLVAFSIDLFDLILNFISHSLTHSLVVRIKNQNLHNTTKQQQHLYIHTFIHIRGYV